MVNEIIKHLNSIGEVNLSAQKIELGLVDDASHYMKQAEIEEAKAVTKLKQAVDIFQEADAKTRQAIEVSSKGLVMAKELGIPVKSLEDALATAKRMEANHKRWISTISTMK
jgi:hypothetical protein